MDSVTYIWMANKSKLLGQYRMIGEFDCCLCWLVDGTATKVDLLFIKWHIWVCHYSTNGERYWGGLQREKEKSDME